MKLTIIQTGDVPPALRPDFGAYPPMFHRMFEAAGATFEYEAVPVFDGAAFPDPAKLDAILITGSAAGVYDDFTWLDPLRAFIRHAYSTRTPMLGICFGHQIMADALGGDVRKSEKGWGLGRHKYEVKSRPEFLATDLPALSIACSHQDQVITPPKEAQVFMGSAFTPNAGLVYANGAALSLQPHPEFTDDYTLALAELRRGKAPDAVVEEAVASVSKPSHSGDMAGWLGAFLQR
ncbi:glutamine amidotransferase-related protein [Devosia sp.]|uniref:glutamine amidotransferase-related protein n=1 Tax=Devosia sp. TaxID=1871048 RepID=UPI003BACBE22